MARPTVAALTGLASSSNYRIETDGEKIPGEPGSRPRRRTWVVIPCRMGP
jgi:hypothetical protein